MLFCVQLFASRSRCKHDVGALSWLNAETVERAPTPLFGRLVRCSAHGPFFARLRVYQSAEIHNCYMQFMHKATFSLKTSSKQIISQPVAIHYTLKYQLANSHTCKHYRASYDLLGRGAYASHSFISITETGTSHTASSFIWMFIFIPLGS